MDNKYQNFTSEPNKELMQEALEHLYFKFDPTVVSERAGPKGTKLLYIEAHDMINHMNNCFGLLWSSEITETKIHDVIGKNDTKPSSIVIVSVKTTINLQDKNGNIVVSATRPGSGGDNISNVSDIDKTIKTAMMNAVKKSLINFGLSLYLWEQEARDDVYEGKRAATELTERNKSVLNKLATEYDLNKQDIGALVKDIFENGVNINDYVIIGSDITCFIHSQQNAIVDYFNAEVRKRLTDKK